MKLSKDSKGFGIVSVLLILGVVGVLGFVGWDVYDAHKKNSSTDMSNSSGTKTPSNQTKPEIAIPAGWLQYKNDQYGVQFDYPKEWGALKTVPISSYDSATVMSSLVSDEYDNQALNIQGSMSLTFYNKSAFTINPEKYGATIKPIDNGTTWQVTAVNPAAADKYKVGDIYDLQGKQKVDGGIIYKLPTTDEGCTFTRYELLLKDTDAELSVPSLCSMDTIPAASQTSYNTIINNIVTTIKIY